MFCDSELFNETYNVWRNDRNYDLTRQTKGGGVLIAVKNTIHARGNPSWSSSAEDLWVTLFIPRTRTTTATHIHLCSVYLCNQAEGNSFNVQLANFQNQLLTLINTYKDDKFLVLGDFNLSEIQWVSSSSEDGLIPHNLTKQIYFDFADNINMCSLKQYNHVTNNIGRILDLVLSNDSVSVFQCATPLVPEDSPHKAICVVPSLDFKPLSPQKTEFYCFKRANYDKIRKILSEVDWEEIVCSGDINEALDSFYKIIYKLRDEFVPKCKSRNVKYPPWYTSSLIRMIKEKFKFFRKFKVYGNKSDEASFRVLRERVDATERECYDNYMNNIEQSICTNPKKMFSYVLDRRKRGTIPSIMTFEDKSCTKGDDISELFSDYFYTTFLSNSSPSSQMPPPSSNPAFELGNLEVSCKQVYELLKSLDLKKSSGPDHLPAEFIVACAFELSLPISLLFKRSFNEGLVPLKWKTAYVSPIHKKGSRENVENYRPISKLSLFAKVLERLVFTQVYKTFSSAFDQCQHGFLKARSTVTNLAVLNDYISEQMVQGNQVDVIYMDYTKAFDRIDHCILLKKLTALDDMKIFGIANNKRDALRIQEDLYRLDDYCTVYKLDLNVSKCFYMHYTTKPTPFPHTYILKQEPLSVVNETNDLGVFHDSKITFVPHIDQAIIKASKALGFIIRTAKPFKTILNMVHKFGTQCMLNTLIELKGFSGSLHDI
ncbi:uncharacterized protein LOC126976049 [Leptidea sinapis]|uniref:uncharacterized protein LOC126976049 n=1 Tax=Leptidea sinapis TaxID=189913 RepID=UPI0021C2BD3F|nr:uncharacterized protein LOC126976049 [Leptidea sinapis]